MNVACPGFVEQHYPKIELVAATAISILFLTLGLELIKFKTMMPAAPLCGIYLMTAGAIISALTVIKLISAIKN